MERYEKKKTVSTRARHKVRIQYRQTVLDGIGGEDTSWVNASFDPIWADVVPIKATQVHEYKSVGVDATHLITISGKIEIDEHDRILFGSRVFEVLTVENINERGIINVCTCEEKR